MPPRMDFGSVPATGREVAEIDAEPLIELGQGDDPTVQINGGLVARVANNPDHALALAEIVGADQMRAVGFGGEQSE